MEPHSTFGWNCVNRFSAPFDGSPAFSSPAESAVAATRVGGGARKHPGESPIDMRSFPFGQAAFSMLVLALLSGAWLAAHPSSPKSATLTYWTFGRTHYLAYRQAVPSFEAAHPGVKVDLQLVGNAA